MQFTIYPPFRAPVNLNITDLPGDHEFWVLSASKTAPYDMAVLSFMSFAATDEPDTPQLRVVDMRTGDVLAGRELAMGELLLPSLVSDLFALRIGRNVKRMWLDVHNVLGLFSLPFHIIMALTAVVFAFHDQFYGAQGMAFGGGAERARPSLSAPAEGPPPATLTPAQIVARVREQAPGFTPETLVYGQGRGGLPALRVQGSDARYGLRAPTYGMAGIDPQTGAITGTDYMPGMQDGWSATITSFFALHFGNFGGNTIRWAYFLLGLAGAFLFYTGNLLWVESRRKKERKAGAVEQTRATRILGALTVGVPLGSIAGISVTLAAAKLLGSHASYGMHSAIYYALFLIATGWALARGAARSGVELAMNNQRPKERIYAN
jgi:uncharacterized iron-regulated membrane protein